MKYTLQTYATGREFEDAGWLLDDVQCDTPSLIRAIYDKKQIEFGDSSSGLYRFADWLPINCQLKGSAAPVTYKSEKLATELGMKNLYITFSGYFPERGAAMTTCSFKETEAFSVCARIDKQDKRVMVVASAGNTARAFAKVCSENKIPLLLCVPHDNLDALWSDTPIDDCVKLVTVEAGADYFDAINLSNIICESEKFYAEGGAKNVARRDGMATTFLSATEAMGRIPDYYFQAVGSGTGTIAAWEANLRLIEDGRFGDHKAKLVVSQNHPFTPMYNAWTEGCRAMVCYDDSTARLDASKIIAKVLSNRKPPYSIAGGLFDALQDAKGEFTKHSNEEIRIAAKLFEKCEGIDIHYASATALASLVDCVRRDKSLKDAFVMLNVTGGGESRFKAISEKIYQMEPNLCFTIDADKENIRKNVDLLFS